MQDSAGAEKWLTSLSSSPERDAAIASYINYVAATSPERAVSWVETFSDSSSRLASIATIAQQWLQSDRPAAEAWIQKLNLPDESKAQVLGSIQQQPPEPVEAVK
jgi:DNA-binding transcriptional regulator YbjK